MLSARGIGAHRSPSALNTDVGSTFGTVEVNVLEGMKVVKTDDGSVAAVTLSYDQREEGGLECKLHQSLAPYV